LHWILLLHNLHIRYHLRIFQQLPHIMASWVSGKWHFFIKNIFGRYFLNKHSKNADFWLSKSIFYVKNYSNLSNIFSIEKYQFVMIFVIDIFWKLQFLKAIYIFFMKKCFFLPNWAAIWWGSCWEVLNCIYCTSCMYQKKSGRWITVMLTIHGAKNQLLKMHMPNFHMPTTEYWTWHSFDWFFYANISKYF